MTPENDGELVLSQLLTKIEEECIRLENRMHAATEEWEAKLEERDNVFKTLELLRRYSPPSSQASTSPIVDERLRQRMSGKTVKEMIIELARENEGQMFRVVDINKKLVLAGMFADTTKAAEGVYSTLGRNPKSFIRIEKGRYLVAPSAIESSAQNGARADGDRDIVERVQAVLAEHPTWDRRQVTDELQRKGFDFGSRKPIFAVGAVFMRLKRGSKDRVQPSLRSIS